jgi:ABC-type multidrug transport system fused ATPase/permease subunit
LFLFSLFHRWHARALIFGLALTGALLGVLSPLFQKIFLDRILGIESLETSRLGISALNGLMPLQAIFGAFLCMLGAQGCGALVTLLCSREATILQRIFGEELYRKTLSIRPDSLGATTVGEIVATYATDVPGATALIDQVFPMAVGIFCNLILGPVAVHLICGIPFGAIWLMIFAVTSLTGLLASRQSRYFSRFKQLAAERVGIVNEWIQSIRLLRILGWTESFERKIFQKREEETANRITMVTNGQFMNAYGSSINFLINLAAIAFLVFVKDREGFAGAESGGRSVVSPGELFALLWIFGVFLQRSFRQLPWFFTFLLDSATSFRRLERHFARPSDAGSFALRQEKLSTLPKSEPLSLQVKGLNLSINGQPILKDVSLEMSPGEFAAVVGEVGCGKTMLLLSLLGETGATFESFHIGETDALTLGLNDRRRYFSFVPQEGFVMSASLRENVAFQYAPAPADVDAGVRESLQSAQFLLEQEVNGHGLDTEIGERGVNLSGGQRQRVSLARAHNCARPIVLLDDCLSAVDVDTEKQLLRELLCGAWENRTRLLVTHRLSVLNRVDKVYFMQDGRILDVGPFKELVSRSQAVRDFVASVTRAEEAVSPAKATEEGVGGEAVAQAAIAEGEANVEADSIS